MRAVTKQFAGFRFDADEGTLWRGAQQVPLTGKAASLLCCLLERAGSWLSKAAIMAACVAGHPRPAGQRQSARQGNPPGPRRHVPRLPVHQVGARPRLFVHRRRLSTGSGGGARARGQSPNLCQSWAGGGGAGRCARCRPRVCPPHGLDLRRTRFGKDRPLRRVREDRARRRAGARLLRTKLCPRAGARALLSVPRRAHCARSPASGICAAHPPRARAVLAGAVSAVGRLRQIRRCTPCACSTS